MLKPYQSLGRMGSENGRRPCHEQGRDSGLAESRISLDTTYLAGCAHVLQCHSSLSWPADASRSKLRLHQS